MPLRGDSKTYNNIRLRSMALTARVEQKLRIFENKVLKTTCELDMMVYPIAAGKVEKCRDKENYKNTCNNQLCKKTKTKVFRTRKTERGNKQSYRNYME